MDFNLEICVDSVASAVAAAAGGADRIELCAALGVGGVTPSIGMIKTVKKLLKIPIYMIVRPRAGDFVYSPDEICVMVDDIRQGCHLGIDGFVTGALRSDRTVDKGACARLLEEANGLPVTFHRAFDLTSNDQALRDVIDLGFKRILTSGRCKTAHEGQFTIKDLINKADSKIIIMPGSGINPLNLQEIIDTTGAVEYHSSGQCREPASVTKSDEAVVVGATASPLTSAHVVRNMKDILRANIA